MLDGLLRLSNNEGMKSRLEDLPDLSQHGNYTGFRNESLDGEPLIIGRRWFGEDSGVLQLDFVSTSTLACSKQLKVMRK